MGTAFVVLTESLVLNKETLFLTLKAVFVIKI